MINDRWSDEIRLLDLPNIFSLPQGDYDLKIVAKDGRGIYKKSIASEVVTWTKPGIFTISVDAENFSPEETGVPGLVYGTYDGNNFELSGAHSSQIFVIENSSGEMTYLAADCGGADGTVTATLNGETLPGTLITEDNYTWFEADPFIPADGDIIHFDIVFVMPEQPEEQEDPGEY